MAFGVLAASFAACVAFAGCSLGLDESRIADAGDASVAPRDSAALPDVIAVDAADANEDAADASGCAADKDCVSSDHCLTGRCDTSRGRGVCTFDVCPTTACHASSCDAATHACTAPAAYGFHAGAIHIASGGVGCSGVAARCIASAGPFVIVGTSNGVVAYAVLDPTASAPPPIPVSGLPFLPAQIVASGARVYFIGDVAGSGPTYKLPLAWLDVPADTRVGALEAHTVFDAIAEASIVTSFPGPDGSLFLVHGNAQKLWPIAIAKAPLTDLDTLHLSPSPGIPNGALPVASSGARVLVYRWPGDATPYSTSFSLETGAGTINAQNQFETSVTSAMGPTYSQPVFAMGGDGSVLWSAPGVVTPDGGSAAIGSTRMAWILNDGASTQLDATAHLDVEAYSPPLPWGTASAGPLAWLDATTALVLALAPGPPNQTSVQVAKRTPSPALVANHRYVLPVGVGSVGASASGGFGYVLAADGVDSAFVHVFAPACSP